MNAKGIPARSVKALFDGKSVVMNVQSALQVWTLYLVVLLHTLSARVFVASKGTLVN